MRRGGIDKRLSELARDHPVRLSQRCNQNRVGISLTGIVGEDQTLPAAQGKQGWYIDPGHVFRTEDDLSTL